MGWIIDLFTAFFSITGNWFFDIIIFAFIELIAFFIAFGLVGRIFDSLGYHNSDLMSGAHWLIRVIVFIIISVALRFLYKIINWLISIKWYIYLISVFSIIAAVISVYVIKHICARKKNSIKAKSDDVDNQKKSKKKIKNYYFYKYWPFIILIFSIGVSIFLYKIGFDFKKIKNLMVTDIIITLIPLIFTIITLSLSLPSETIYGQSFSLIRKIRKDRHFRFGEMIALNILIFLLLSVFEVFKLTIQVWTLDIVSLIYCILFCCQEVPILVKNNDYIKKIIKKSGYFGELSKNTDLFDGNTSDGKKVEDIIQYILLKDGIVSTYNSFKTEDESKNALFLDKLLTLQSSYLLKCNENRDFFASASITTFNQIEILDAIEMSFSNILDCIMTKNDFNYISVVKNTDSYYLIGNSIINLHSLMKRLNLEEKFNSQLKSILRSGFMKIKWGKQEGKERNFIYRILNNLLIYTISNNEMWFIELIRDAAFDTRFFYYGIDYFYFITMYLFFIAKIEKRVTDDIKESIDNLLKSNCNGLNSEKGDNIITIFNFNWHYKRINEFVNLLPNLLEIYESCKECYQWFQPPLNRSWSSADGEFDKAFIIKNWFILIITNPNGFNLNYEDLVKIESDLSDDDKKVLIYTLEDSFINNNQLVIKNAEDIKYITFYNSKPYNSLSYNKDLSKKIIEKIQSYDKAELMDLIESYIKTEEDLKHIKDELIERFKETVKNFEICDSNISVDLSKKWYLPLLMLNEDTDQLCELSRHYFKNTFENILYNELNRNLSNKTNIDIENAEKVTDSILKENYDYRSGGLFTFFDLKVDEEKIKSLYEIKERTLPLSNLCFWKDGALKLNIICDEERTVVRHLNIDEINKMIDKDFSQVDGLYKYNRYSNDNKSIFVSRDELIDIISKRNIYICIVFSYKIDIDEKSIISICEKEENE